MQLTRLAGGGAGLLALLWAGPASGELVVDDQAIGYLFNYFADSDHVHVYSHYTDYDVDLENGRKLYVQWNHQVVVVPGVAAPPGSDEAVDAITSASRPVSSQFGAFESFAKTRNQIEADVDYGPARGGYYVSKESDYFAQQVSGNVDHDLFGQTLNVSVGASYGWDDIEPLADDDTAAESDRKTTWHWNTVLTRVLTQTTIVMVGGEWNAVRGLQHNPYRNVYAGGTNVPELHPDERIRRDVYVKLNQYFKNRSSVKLDYKYYTDDWGVSSHTVGAGLNQYVGDDVIVSYRYRHYDQAPADFFREEYDTIDGIGGFRTGDYRLGDFSSHLFGTRVSWNLRSVFGGVPTLSGLSLNMKYERYFNTNNFSANIFESGLALAF